MRTLLIQLDNVDETLRWTAATSWDRRQLQLAAATEAHELGAEGVRVVSDDGRHVLYAAIFAGVPVESDDMLTDSIVPFTAVTNSEPKAVVQRELDVLSDDELSALERDLWRVKRARCVHQVKAPVTVEAGRPPYSVCIECGSEFSRGELQAIDDDLDDDLDSGLLDGLDELGVLTNDEEPH